MSHKRSNVPGHSHEDPKFSELKQVGCRRQSWGGRAVIRRQRVPRRVEWGCPRTASRSLSPKISSTPNPDSWNREGDRGDWVGTKSCLDPPGPSYRRRLTRSRETPRVESHTPPRFPLPSLPLPFFCYGQPRVRGFGLEHSGGRSSKVHRCPSGPSTTVVSKRCVVY